MMRKEEKQGVEWCKFQSFSTQFKITTPRRLKGALCHLPSSAVSFSKFAFDSTNLSLFTFHIPSRFNTHQPFHNLSLSLQQPVMPSGPKRRKAAKKKKQQTPILHSSPTLQVVSVNCNNMEEESANHKVEDIQKEESQLDEIVKEVGFLETEDSEYVKEIDIGDDSSSSSSEEESKPEEKSPEFVEQAKLEEKQEEISDSFVASLEPEDLLQAVEIPVENSEVLDVSEVESEKIEEKLSEKIEEKLSDSVDDCNGISPVEAEIVPNGTKETKLAAAEEKNEASAGVVDLVSKGNIDDLLQEAVVVPPVEPSAAESQISESRAYEVAAVDTSNVGEHHNEPEIPESTGYQPPIIPVTQRTLHPTSWRSCCGLFDVLRRSDR